MKSHGSRRVLSPRGPDVISSAKTTPLFTKKDLQGDIELDWEDDEGTSPPPPPRRSQKEIRMDEIRKKLAYLHWKKVRAWMEKDAAASSHAE
jgi:hypothetical protein